MHILIAVLLSALITVVLIAFSAWIMLSGKLTVGTEKIILNAIRIISCFAGGFLCGKKNKKRGFLWGLLVGAIYYVLLVVLRTVTGSHIQETPLNTITTMLCCIGSGMLGGMLS